MEQKINKLSVKRRRVASQKTEGTPLYNAEFGASEQSGVKTGSGFGMFLGNVKTEGKQVKSARPQTAKKTKNSEDKPQKQERTSKQRKISANVQTQNAVSFSPLTKQKKQKTAENGQKGKNKKKKAGVMPVKILFLGGVGEIGKNMTAVEYGDDILIIDAGNAFPDAEMPGVDLVVPDPSYLVERKHKIKGILLTHGHEDHIGGLAYLLKEIGTSVPVFGTQLTLALADNKIRELRLQKVKFRKVKPGDKVKLGALSVEFVNVNHSIAGAVALAITTPFGLIYHSGDFKIDMTPVAGNPIDLKRIAQLGEKGVLLYMGESTNIERPGYTMSETVVGATLDHLFAEHATRRLIIATFASNVHRLQQIIDLAVKYKRKVALSGRSMLNVVDAATKIGELNIPEGVLVDVERSKNFFDKELVIVSTGSQGEPMSALTRMASGEFNKIVIGENDTIIISASPIPGNEKMVYKVINNLYKQGAKVVYESLEKIHVSGHACQEEHKILHTLLKPKFFIPVHGEYRHLYLHGELAKQLGMPKSNVFLADIGNCVELTDTTLTQGENIAVATKIIDGTGADDYNTSEAIRDRKLIAAEGAIIVTVATTGGAIVSEPSIECVGILFGDERDYETEIRGVVLSVLAQYDLQYGDYDGLKKSIERSLKGYLYRKAKQSPLIKTMILQI